MTTLTVKRGDKYDVKLSIHNAPMDLTAGVVKVHVTPSVGGSATVFNATIDSNDVVTWPLDGTLPVGKYKLEVQVTVGGWIVTSPSDDMMDLLVLQDLA